MTLKDRVPQVQALVDLFIPVVQPQVLFEDGAIVFDAFTITEAEVARRRIGGEIFVPGFELNVLVPYHGAPDEPDFDSLVELEVSTNFDEVVRKMLVTYLDKIIAHRQEAEGLAAMTAEQRELFG